MVSKSDRLKSQRKERKRLKTKRAPRRPGKLENPNSTPKGEKEN